MSGFPRTWLSLGLVATVAAKLLFEAALLRHLHDPRLTPLRRSALLVRGPLVRTAKLRLVLGVLGGIAMPLALAVTSPWLSPALATTAAAIIVLTLLGGELAERYLFFAAVVRPKMPGGVLT